MLYLVYIITALLLLKQMQNVREKSNKKINVPHLITYKVHAQENTSSLTD